MKITQDVRDYAAGLEAAKRDPASLDMPVTQSQVTVKTPQELAAAMAQKSAQFAASGSELYHPINAISVAEIEEA
jgi:phosphomethylpyrimidine synthase